MVVTVINSLEEFNEIVGLSSDSSLIDFLTTRKIREPSSVVIEFCAGWCGPSQKINPTFDKCSELLQYYGLSFYRVDIDNQPAIVQVANVQKVCTNLPLFIPSLGLRRCAR